MTVGAQRRWSVRLAVLVSLLVPLLAAQRTAASAVATPQGAGAEQGGGRVVLVGDSIMLGARDQLDAVFSQAGHVAVVDAAESRSTLAGAAVVADRLAEQPADAVVVMLGANDGADPGAYRERVRRVVAATALVPRLYWVTVPEVRSYYPAANQVVREELALRPGAEVLDWAAAGAGGGLTAGDGLHLTGQGADVMAFFVGANVVEDLRSDAVAAASSTTSAPATTSPSTSSPDTSSPDTSAPDTADPPGAAPTTTEQGTDAVSEVEDAAETAADSSIWRIAAGTGVAATAMTVVLGILGASLAVWALWRTRGRA